MLVPVRAVPNNVACGNPVGTHALVLGYSLSILIVLVSFDARMYVSPSGIWLWDVDFDEAIIPDTKM